jgi:putative oxidoreductase
MSPKTQSLGQLVLRLALGGVMLPHGLQKALGLFGGQGFSATVDFFEKNLQVPPYLTWLVIAAETLGSLGLIFGLATRLCALGVLAVMAGAVWMVHLDNGFFMNWNATPQQGEGFEYHILAMGMATALVILGGGYYSLDRMLRERKHKG